MTQLVLASPLGTSSAPSTLFLTQISGYDLGTQKKMPHILWILHSGRLLGKSSWLPDLA